MSARIRVDLSNHVAHVRLVRADKMNALDAAMFRELVDAGDGLREQPDLRAVVLSGEGRGFCAGIDLANLAQDADRERTLREIQARTHHGMNLVQYAVMQWRRLPVPVIAAVHDVAYGGGFQLMLGADMRFLAPNARLSIMEIQWGLIPDMGGILLLRDLLRPDVAAELMMSGRIISGEEAARIGLATRVCENPVADALAFAREIAARSPEAIRAGKRLLALQDDALCQRILLSETSEQVALLRSANHAEAVRAGLARVRPLFGPALAPTTNVE